MPGKKGASRIRIMGVTTAESPIFGDRWKFGPQGMPYRRFSELAEIPVGPGGRPVDAFLTTVGKSHKIDNQMH
jgi:hypothetical protein